MLKYFRACGCAALFVFLPQVFFAAPQKSVKRYAVIVGANDGGASRGALRFAVSDANSFMKVLSDAGGLDAENSALLFQPNRANLLSVLNATHSKVLSAKQNSTRIEFIFYYSGHSDEDGILLSNEKVSYRELKKAIQTIPADVRIAILDSCFSGAFIQMKGGVKRAPFMLDTSYDMKGNAFMSSSSRDEASQESERIKGSFFTHYLVLGLRGAADVTQDRRITLNEAYQFAYRETLMKTEKTIGGVQHPNYNIQMVGTGDVVLTDVASVKSRLSLDEMLEGRFHIFGKNNVSFGEIDKDYGRTVDLALEEGDYTVVRNDGAGYYEAKIRVRDGRETHISFADFDENKSEVTAMRGSASSSGFDPDSAVAGKKQNSRTTLITGDVFRKKMRTLYDIDYSGYVAVNTRFSKLGESLSTWVGGRVLLILDSRFCLGFAGYGLTNPLDRQEVTGREYSFEEAKLGAGYGGFLAEYYFNSNRTVHYSVGCLVGAGGVGYYSENDSESTQERKSNADAFFVLEPEAFAHVNLAWLVKLSVGVSFRFTNGIDNSDSHIGDRQFCQPTLGFMISLGWF